MVSYEISKKGITEIFHETKVYISTYNKVQEGEKFGGDVLATGFIIYCVETNFL